MNRAVWLAGLTALLAVFAGGCSGKPESPPATQRTIVLGFDGMDPRLTEQWMDEGQLPHFAALRAKGYYQRLATTNPPQSPVAWASFATGTDPGEHGIFDFLRRASGSYAPDFGIAEQSPPDHVWEPFGWRITMGGGDVHTRRHGTPLWVTAEDAGQRATVLRVPVTYPPDPVHRMLSGMGVPDLLGTQGTYTLLATRPVANADNGGRVLLAPIGEDGSVSTQLAGPPHPLYADGRVLSVPLTLRPQPDGALLDLDGITTPLQTGKWSAWLRVHFRVGVLGAVTGMTRAYLSEGFPRPLLYLAPIQADPTDPAMAISSPPTYAAELARKIGDYHTLGMPEETWSLNQGHLDEKAWLDTVATTLHEGEAMLYDALDRHDSELVIEVFVQTDRVSHMFWRGIDDAHPLHASASPLARHAIADIYREADRVLGEVSSRMDPKDRLVVLSDHGFSSFRRTVHLNRWLVEHGYMTLKPGADPNQPLFSAIDWSHTRAYALGLNGVFINRQGREPQGIVDANDAATLKSALRSELALLRDADGSQIVQETYDADAIYSAAHRAEAPDLVIGYAPGYRASWQTSLGAVPTDIVEDNRQFWSGDHCIAPEAVPGVLFTSFAPQHTVESIAGLAALLDIPRNGTAVPAHAESGWFDVIGAPVAKVDAGLGVWIPEALRLMLWGGIAGTLGMAIYRRLSPQERIASVRQELLVAQQALSTYDGPFAGLPPLMRRQLHLSLRQLWLSLGPSVVSGAPVLPIWSGLSQRMDAAPHRFLPWLPAWMSGWEAVFIIAALVASLFFKRRWQIK